MSQRGSFHSNQLTDMVALWHKSQPIVAAFVSASVSNEHDAEDLVQQVALAAAKDFDKYDPATPFLRWAIAIARNRILNYRRQATTGKIVFNSETIESLAQAAERYPYESSDLLDALRACLKLVKGRASQILEMRYMHIMKPDKIARRLSMTVNAVTVQLHRTRRALEQCINSKLSRKGEQV